MMPIALALDAAVALFKRYRIMITVVPLALALAWQTYQVSRWKGKEAKAQATIAQMQLASEQARAAQLALNQTNQELIQRIATDAIARRKELADATNRAVSDYASRHRVQDYCRRGGSSVAALPSDPGTPDSPQSDEVLAVPRQDFDALAQDALRGAETRVWLIDQINAGLAVVYPEPKLSGE
jgi:hypothetical protein